jgi:hypothetical protein
MNAYSCPDLLGVCLDSLAPPLISCFASTYSRLGPWRVVVVARPGVCFPTGDRLFFILSYQWHDLLAKDGYVVLEV